MNRKCRKCKKTKQISDFKMSGAYRIGRCYDCVKKDTNKHNANLREKIKEYAQGCWWIEQYCYASLFYYGGQNKRR
tara:strand:+ start:2558 stop:2785 length:228 start_codon:yes stop_codon:yes gene_type:complete